MDAALNEIFNLNDNEVEAMDNALIGIVGEGVDDLQDAIVHEPGWAESPSGEECNSQAVANDDIWVVEFARTEWCALSGILA